jgi:hypothetical protein
LPRALHPQPATIPTRNSVASSTASTSLHSFKQQVDVALKAHVASVCFKCFRCFKSILQVFHMDVTKGSDVAYVYVASVCSKYVSSVFRRMLLSVFILLLHMFAVTLKCFCKCFSSSGCIL